MALAAVLPVCLDLDRKGFESLSASQPLGSFSSSASSFTPTNLGGTLGLRLRDLVLRFPCALLDGVRWSVLCKVYRDRFPEGPSIDKDTMAEARMWLLDIVEFQEEVSVIPGMPEARLNLRDAAALHGPGREGQLACWPLLVQRLGEIVRAHGSIQPASALEVHHEEDDTLDGALSNELQGPEVVGVLLSQLKPLLRRQWDPGFEERSVGFFSEIGTYVSVKKMKHLVAQLLKWRVRRLTLRLHDGRPSAVDAALEAPLQLRVSSRHNDMVLCCSSYVLPVVHESEPLVENEEAQLLAGPAHLVSSLTVAEGQPRFVLDGERPRQPLRFDRPVLQPLHPMDGPILQSPQEGAKQQQKNSADVEKENRRLRIENAELKKKLRFDSEFLHKQIRRLRIENAELKKRIFVPDHEQSTMGKGTPSFPQWTTALTPVVMMVPTAPVNAQHSGQSTPVNGAPHPIVNMLGGRPLCGSVSSFGDGLSSSASSEAGSPRKQGSTTPSQATTPIQHGYCYVPMGQTVMSPVSQPCWPTADIMQVGPLLAAMPLAARPMGVGEISSPYSDGSYQQRLLPTNLLGSDNSGSASVSDVGGAGSSPERHPMVGQPQVPNMPIQRTDDRWVSIPSGIVDRYKQQFEADSSIPVAGEWLTIEEQLAQAIRPLPPADTTEVSDNEDSDEGESIGSRKRAKSL